jgi:hypothetical protein
MTSDLHLEDDGDDVLAPMVSALAAEFAWIAAHGWQLDPRATVRALALCTEAMSINRCTRDPDARAATLALLRDVAARVASSTGTRH